MADKKVSDLPSLNGADVDAADLLYIVDSSAGAAGSKKITVGQYQLAPVSGGTANTVVYLNGSKVESSSSALTFDGTNLGIGTSSPGAKLDVSGSVNAVQARFGNVAGRGLEIGTSIISGTNDAGSVLNAKGATSGTMIFQTDSTERMRLDSSGNLGLGVTPSAWSVIKAIEIGGFRNSVFSDNGSVSVGLASGSYYNAGWKYAVTGSAVGYYEVAGNAHRWFSAPSGTAGNAISFTQAMTLDASGNLGVGAVSPGNRFYVNGPQASPQIRATDGNVDIYVAYSSGTGASAVSYFGTNSNHPQVFITNNTERARITSGGDLLVGTATTPSSSNAGFVVTKDADGTYLRNACTITTSRTHFEFVNGNGTVGTISTNASATAYNTSSDRRLKEGIAPAADAGPIIDAIEVVQHDWKVGGHTRFGVIAQDLNAVAPEAVSAGDDGDEIKKTWGVDYSKLVPMLIKEIQSLRARVAALEAK